MAVIDTVVESVREDLDRVEHSLFSSLNGHIDLIQNVSGYVLSSGGKRFRPLMLILAARFCNYRGDQHIPLACILEYIHTATLLHDDVIDHARIRRGNSSANVLWGDHTTILVGDFLLSKAFSLAIELGNMQILKVLSETATLMVEAETIQEERAYDPQLSEEEYFEIITKKTASLIAAASRIGAILANVNSGKERALAEYGLNVGIAFQIMDDVLDYSANENDLGKAIGKDIREGSITLPFIEAFKRSSEQDRKILGEIVRRGRELEEKDLAVIFDLINKYDGSRRAVDKAKAYTQRAAVSLKLFDNPADKELLALAEYALERKS
ncbi:MAG: polyprenyl synthetase family protein [Proteobacteria bacterium]|nr:polyprenyl synthetase family protein [Pseudomonadota bacterium]